jgi:hypothetical protein
MPARKPSIRSGVSSFAVRNTIGTSADVHAQIKPEGPRVQNVFEIFANGWIAGVFVAGQVCDGVECLLLIVEPAFERDRSEIDLLLYGVVELRATQSPHVAEVKRANYHQRHGDTRSEQQQFAANPQLLPPDRRLRQVYAKTQSRSQITTSSLRLCGRAGNCQTSQGGLLFV